MASRDFDTRVKELTAHVQKQFDEKERYKKAEDQRTERQRLIDSVPDVTPTEFYCECHGDFIAMGGKCTFKDGYGQMCAYYVSHGTAIGAKGNLQGNEGKRWHACRCKRRITDKTDDPYYNDSPLIKKLRKQMEIDMLQPGDPRFKQHWGDPYKQLNAKREAEEKATWESQRS